MTKEQLKEVALKSNVLEVGKDFLSEDLRYQFQAIISNPQDIPSDKFREMYLRLKQQISAT